MGDALDDKSAEQPRPPKRRRRGWLSYSVRGLFVLVLLAALPAWWIRSQLDAFAAEHDVIELLRNQGARVYTKSAEPEWLWKHLPGGTTPPRAVRAVERRGGGRGGKLPGGTTPPRAVRGRRVGGDRDDDEAPPARLDRREFSRNFRSRFPSRRSQAPTAASRDADSGATRRERSSGDAANGWRGGGPDRGEQTRRNGSFGDAAQAADAGASHEARRRLPGAAERAAGDATDAPASRPTRNVNNQPPGGPALMLREHATMVHLPRGKADDAQMKLIARLKHLERLSIYDGKITDAGLANCAALRTLVGLDLVGCKSITDDGLRYLRRAEKLESLRLNSTRVGDRGMAFVAELPALKWFYAADTEIGNNGLRQLARIESLEHVGLTGTKVDDRGVGELARCKKLRELHLPIGVTAAGLAKLSSLKELTMMTVSAGGQLPLAPFQKLESLNVRLQTLDDGSALREVKRLAKLHGLRVSGDGITDATLRSLKGAIKRQCYITVTGGRISEAGVRALAPSLPRGSGLHLEESPLGYEASARLSRHLRVNTIPVVLIVRPKSDVVSPFASPKRSAGAGRGGFGGERGQRSETQATERETHGATLEEQRFRSEFGRR